MLAAMNGYTAAVKLLLDLGSDINAQTPLMVAASGGYVEEGRRLLNVNVQVPSSGDTALTIAADKGHYRFVELLLSSHAAVDVKNKKGNSPLWLACHGGHRDMVQKLVTAGADIDSQDNRKVSCLMAAFRQGHIEVVKCMVEHVNQFPSDGDLSRYIATITDKELQKKCQQCMEIIVTAKDRQAAEADKERQHEENKKAAAAKKREKKKKKKKKKKEKQVKDKEEPSKNSTPEPESEDSQPKELDEEKEPPSATTTSTLATEKKTWADAVKTPIQATDDTRGKFHAGGGQRWCEGSSRSPCLSEKTDSEPPFISVGSRSKKEKPALATQHAAFNRSFASVVKESIETQQEARSDEGPDPARSSRGKLVTSPEGETDKHGVRGDGKRGGRSRSPSGTSSEKRSQPESQRERSRSLARPHPISTENLVKMKNIIFLDLDNWSRFFSKLPRSLPDLTFVWGFYGGRMNWKEPSRCVAFNSMKTNNTFYLHERCGQTKNAADIAITFKMAQMHERLPEDIHFTIVSGDKGFIEVLRQMLGSNRRVVVIDPHKAQRVCEDKIYTMIISVSDTQNNKDAMSADESTPE